MPTGGRRENFVLTVDKVYKKWLTVNWYSTLHTILLLYNLQTWETKGHEEKQFYGPFLKLKYNQSQEWWYKLLIPALGKQIDESL